MSYIHKDHLGSYVCITNADGTLLEELSYDPWGRRRTIANWDYSNVTPPQLLSRGYCGHEHLDDFNLINMNGRIYDPLLSMFISTDPFVQALDNVLNFNRYSYCLNNPLKYSDKSGYFSNLIIGALIGGTINWIAHGAEFNWDGLGYFGIGAAAGALSAGIGSGVNSALISNGSGFSAGFMGTAPISSTGILSGAISGAAAGVTNGLITGTGNMMMSGNNFASSFLDGGFNQAKYQGVAGAIFGGVVGGIDAYNNNRDIWTGARNNSQALAFNNNGNLVKTGTSGSNGLNRDQINFVTNNNVTNTVNNDGSITYTMKTENGIKVTGIRAANQNVGDMYQFYSQSGNEFSISFLAQPQSSYNLSGFSRQAILFGSLKTSQAVFSSYLYQSIGIFNLIP